MAAKIDDDDLTTCQICFEQFTSPKRLPCHHTFCHPCLKSYIKTHLGGEGKRGQDFPCPVCRQVVSIVDNTLSLETIADTFPDNQLIASLIERSTGTGKTQKEQLCGPCSRDNKELAATHWCKYCLEAICDQCTTFHKRFDPSKHIIIPVEEMVEEKSTALLDEDEPCMIHAGEVLKVYCVNHKELCCVICLATLHRKCEQISTFDEMIKKSEKEETFEHFDNKLSEMDKKSDELKTKTEKNLSDLNGRHAEITKNVSSAVQKAKDKLDQLQTTFDLEFQQKHKEETMKLTERMDRIEIFQNNVRKGQKLLHAVREHGSPKQLFITKEKLKQQLRGHVKTLGEDLQDAKSVDYTLKMDGVVTSVTQSVDSVAQAEIKHSSGLTKDVTDIEHVVNELNGEHLKTTQLEPIDIMQLKVHQVGKIDTKIFTGGIYLTDGRMVFCNWNERKLQAFDQSGKLLFESSALEHQPLDMCDISDKNILVSFYNQNYIKKYEVTNNGLIEQDKIQCKEGPLGLAVSEDEIIVGYGDEVDILFLEGSFKKILTTRAKDYLSYVAVSVNTNILYTSGDEVVCKTSERKELTRFTHTKLKRPFGITTDKSGNVYVCGFDSHNVCVFSPDGNKMKILIEGITKPYKIKFNPQGTGFFVTSNVVGAYIYEMRK